MIQLVFCAHLRSAVFKDSVLISLGISFSFSAGETLLPALVFLQAVS